jgi:hypothetical protein
MFPVFMEVDNEKIYVPHSKYLDKIKKAPLEELKANLRHAKSYEEIMEG